jgi:hypothetical protein
MAWSCPAASPAINNTNYMAKFNDQIDPTSTTTPKAKERSCLPNNGDGFNNNEKEGENVRQSSIDHHAKNMIDYWNAKAISVEDLSSRDSRNPNQIIVSQELNPAKVYSTNAQKFRESIRREYCFYYNRYVWALRDVLGKAAAGNTGSEYVTMKTNVALLNSKLNQILQILQGVTNHRSASLNTYYGSNTGVNTLNSELNVLREQLAEHSEKLKDKALEQNVQSAMIDYSLEKNASSRNLLGIYGFMNIVAIGLLFYLYRSSKN